MEESYDSIILRCIEDKFKTSREIANETQISQHRVITKLNVLMKFDMVISMQGSSDRGVKPKLFKKK